MPSEPTKPMTWEEAWEEHSPRINDSNGSLMHTFRAGFQSRDAEVEQLKADLRTALRGWESEDFGASELRSIAAIRERWSL